MWEKDVFYILEPSMEQSVSLARLIRRNSRFKVAAVTTRDRKERVPKAEYDAVYEINDYKEIPEGLRIIPTGASSTASLLAVRDVVLGDIVLERTALVVYDKRAFLSLCRDSSLPIPVTYSTIRDVPESAYPIFYKEAYERGCGLRGIAFRKEEIPRHEEGRLIFQEYIDTLGTYGVGFLARKGELLVAFSHFELESYPAVGGSGVIVERVDEPALIDLTGKVVKTLNFSGWGLAEFKYNRVSKCYVIMEVNAKFWASCEFAFYAEPEFAKRLFGIEVHTVAARRCFFVNRGLARGVRFMLRNMPLILNSRIIVMPGWGRMLLKSVIPRDLRGLSAG